MKRRSHLNGKLTIDRRYGYDSLPLSVTSQFIPECRQCHQDLIAKANSEILRQIVKEPGLAHCFYQVAGISTLFTREHLHYAFEALPSIKNRILSITGCYLLASPCVLLGCTMKVVLGKYIMGARR